MTFRSCFHLLTLLFFFSFLMAPDGTAVAQEARSSLSSSGSGGEEDGDTRGRGDDAGPSTGEDEGGAKIPWPELPFLGKKKDGEDESEESATGGGSALPPVPAGLLGVGDEEEEAANVGKVVELERQAERAFRMNRVAESIRYINDLITIKPYEADYHFALGLCYRKEDRRQEALKKYQDVLDLGGPKALVALLKAELFAMDGNRDKVYEFLKEAAIGGRNIITDVHNVPVLETFREETEFIKLALQLERVEVQRGRRHDPFTNPFPKDVPDGPRRVTKASGDGPLTKEQQAKMLRDGRRLAERIQFYIKLQDEDKAMAAYIQLKEMVAQQKRITVPKIEAEFREIVRSLPDIEVQISGIRLRYYYNQAQQKLKDMREVFEDGEYARVERIHLELENLAREMRNANAAYGPVIEQVMERSSLWLKRARVRLEFETIKPEIQGIIISGDAKLTILDERPVRQGESLDGLRVIRIESNRVTFQYKGEEIPMVFRRY